ncbi:NGG1p interacting factor NIF3 [Spongiibacter sp. KMU-158]|uniref:NGG1p interacting factor NIF3 n=1 Tax=Spongiibacter pelagi TaxID=2760804 RepID=A0A927C4T5_9GAMM|nr:NGG1p interacting factor NIF3 [Spongiibacter pelagi]MBD2860168.1 NGG1p interacting factor NIF3 [Spongiibacter pelagi]
MYKLVFFVPTSHVEQVKSAVFAAGAGQQGNYEHCCWQTLGQGQFRPNADANPFVGKAGTLETVDEYRVETLCDSAQLKAVVAALKAAHPYEEPAFDITALVDVGNIGD